MQLFEDDLRVIGTDADHQHLLGMRLHGIDDTALPEVIERLKPVLMGVENAYSERHQLATTLPVAEVLNGLGITASTQSAEFIFMDDLDWKNGIYVLTGPQTFSAAMSNSAQYRQILNARLVGEPTGANPVGYQDAGTFQLPHSGWTVMYSKRLYRFQETATEGVQPDVLIAPDWEEFRAGVDGQLEWVLGALGKAKTACEFSVMRP